LVINSNLETSFFSATLTDICEFKEEIYHSKLVSVMEQSTMS